MGFESGRTVRLGDFVDVVHGHAFKTKYANGEPSSYALFTRKNVAPGGGFRDAERRYYHGKLDERFVLAPGDLMLVLTDLSKDGDLLGFPAMVPQAREIRYLHNQRVGKVVIREPGIDPGFLYALFRSPDYRRYVLDTASQTTVRDTAPSRLREYKFELPLPAEQRRIAGVLGALDNKIDSNRRLAEVLEAAAAELFRGRFINFIGLEEFEDSEVGPIPKGWAAGELADLVQVRMGQSPPGSSYTEDPEDGVLLVQGMGGFGSRYPSSQVYTTAPTKRARPGTTLMTVRAPVGAVNIARSEVCLGRGVAGIDSDHQAFVEFLVRSLAYRWASEESGTIFPAVNGTQIRKLPVVLPPREAIADFDRLVAPFIAKLSALHNEAATLGDLRALLLPRLVSGEIRVPDTADADEIIGPSLDEGDEEAA